MKTLLLAGKILGAILVFSLAFVPAQIFIWALLMPGSSIWDDWVLPVLTLASVLSLPIWAIAYWRATGEPKSKARLMKALWVVVPLFLGGLLSIPVYVLINLARSMA